MLKYLKYPIYRHGSTGFSNLVMSLELGVVMAALLDRVLVLEGNVSPIANIVEYGPDTVSNRNPGKVTDYFDVPVPWLGEEQTCLDGLPAESFCGEPFWNVAFCYPPEHRNHPDLASFLGKRKTAFTVTEQMQNVPVLTLDSGPKANTLGFYSYFFFLDDAHRDFAWSTLKRMQPKEPYARLAAKVADDLGDFNAVHIRRGDFKTTMGKTVLGRTSREAIDAMDIHFSRDHLLVIVTDERDDPFIADVAAAYTRHVFIDHHILENYRQEFADLPVRDSLALAFLSQLVAGRSKDFIGTMTSTFTAMIQRYRGNNGLNEPFKFLWNELPAADSTAPPGRHAPSTHIPLKNGVMVETGKGPFSWNRYSPDIEPTWMREWPESFLHDVRRSISVPQLRKPPEDRSSRVNAMIGRVAQVHTDLKIAINGHVISISAADREVIDRLSHDCAFLLTRSEAGTTGRFAVIGSEDGFEIQFDGQSIARGVPLDRLALPILSRAILYLTGSNGPDWLMSDAFSKNHTCVVILKGPESDLEPLEQELEFRGWRPVSRTMTPVNFAKGLIYEQSGADDDGGPVLTGRPVDAFMCCTDLGPAVREGGIVRPSVAAAQLMSHCLGFAGAPHTYAGIICGLLETRHLRSAGTKDVNAICTAIEADGN